MKNGSPLSRFKQSKYAGRAVAWHARHESIFLCRFATGGTAANSGEVDQFDHDIVSLMEPQPGKTLLP